MVAGEGRTPVGKNANKFSLGDVRLYMSFGEVGESEPLNCSFQKEPCAIEHKLPLDPDVDLSAILFELPHVEAATVGRQAKVEAVVAGQVLRRFRPLAFDEVGG